MPIFKTLFPYLKAYKLQIFLASIALIVAALTVLGMGQGLKFLIDDGFTKGDEGLLDKALFVLFIIVTVLSLASFTRYFFVSWVGERVVADLRKDVFKTLINLDPSFFEINKTGEILSRLTADLTVLQSVIGSSVSLALRNSLMMIGGLIMLAFTSPKLTALVLLVVPLVIVPIVYWGRKVRKKSKEAQDKVAEVSSFTDEALQAVRTLHAFVQETKTALSFNEKAEDAYKTARDYIFIRGLMSAFVIFIVFSAVGVILWIGGQDVIKGNMTAGELSAFVFYAVIVAGAVGVISEVASNIQRAAGAIERLFGLKSEITSVPLSTTPATLSLPVQGRVGFKGVSFAYPLAPQKNIFEDLSFDVEAGRSLAIVGPSGAGKTSLFSMLMRYYDPQQGSVTLDDVDIKDLTFEGLRGHIGVVPQDPFIFSGTVYENVAIAHKVTTENTEPAREDIIQALKSANAWGFVSKLDHGMETILGERGIRLSGGEKQRIAIARVLLRNPTVLLLDEATSALDSQNERDVQIALENLMEGRTTLIIAHRLSTVQNADSILVLEDGKIIQHGDHNALIKDKDGLYAQMATLQFKSDNKAA